MMQRFGLTLILLVCCSLGDSLVAKDFDTAELQTQLDAVVRKVAPASVSVGRYRGRRAVGTFSAVIVSPQGHVLTAAHAISPGGTYSVNLPDGRTFRAQAMGVENVLDCGLLKIEKPKNLPFVELGWSASLKPNQPCVSFGYPGTMNRQRGVVMRFGRIVNTISSRRGMIQSTCLMEPGDSGGPLVDMQGRLIGIHSYISVDQDSNFEISVDHFRRYWGLLNEVGEFRGSDANSNPTLGFELARSRRRRGSSRSAAQVTKVDEDGPAAAAGMQVGDRVVEVAGAAVGGSLPCWQLLYRQYTLRNRQVPLTVRRNGERTILQLAVPEYTNDSLRAAGVSETSPAQSPVAPVRQMRDLSSQFVGLESKLDDGCALVRSRVDGKPQQALATFVSLAGAGRQTAKKFDDRNLLISKSSLVGASPSIELDDATSCAATVLHRSEENDLVLLAVPESCGQPIDLFADERDKRRGQILLTPNPAGFGRVSVLGSDEFRSRRQRPSGFLGVLPVVREQQVALNQVVPDSAAEEAELQVGDIVLSIDGTEIESPNQMIRLLGRLAPGDEIELRLLRDESELAKRVKLGARPEREGLHAADRLPGGKSKRRNGFSTVFSHDAKLLPTECGGPVFDLDGEFLGINIARCSRTRSYVIPKKALQRFIAAASN